MNDLATFAPRLTSTPNFCPTGNLSVALPEIDRADGRVHSIGVVLASCAGVMTAHGGPDGLARPGLIVDDEPQALALTWTRQGDWLPRCTATLETGIVEANYVAPEGERGVALSLAYRHQGSPARVELTWRGGWGSTSVEHLRSKPVQGSLGARDDPWTGSRVVTLTSGLPLLALAWRAGPDTTLTDDDSGTGWVASTSARLTDGDELRVEVYVGVAPEPDGACTTALHLRRRGFDALVSQTVTWLDEHRLNVDGPLGERLNTNLFFNYFYAQADCLDDGRPVLLTSRSPHYYVCAAFWSRDAYLWSFPALLLVDHARARSVLVTTLRAGGPRLPDHALYLNGTSLYPGFELDQAAAPILAVARYVAATDDWSVLTEPDVVPTLLALVERIERWRHPSWSLYATFLLPTDDPTDAPYVATCNALVATAFEALAGLLLGAAVRNMPIADGPSPQQLMGRANHTRAAVLERLVVETPTGRMLAWACDEEGRTELRDEPPLGLVTAPFWGLGRWDDPVHIRTRRWLREEQSHCYHGRYGGAGSPHFPYPSGFDLANRLLDRSTTSPDPLEQLMTTPMDQGLACESWDPHTGLVTTGAAMASMAGLLVYCAWTRLSGVDRWDEQPPGAGGPP